MTVLSEISQRDLRLRSKEIMDAVESGETFIVTRDGRPIAELVPIRRRRFVSRVDFVTSSAFAPEVDLDRFRDDQDAAGDQALTDPYRR